MSMPSYRPSPFSLSVIVRAALAGFAYWAAMMLSYSFGGGFVQEADIWIASGVSIGVLTLADPARWPVYIVGLALGALIGNLTSGAGLFASIVYALTEVVVAAPIAWLLRRVVGPRPALDEASKVLWFVAIGAFGSALFSLLLNAAAYSILGLSSPLPAWRLWIVSGTVGTLLVAPLLFAWAGFRGKRSGGPTMSDLALGGPLFALLIVVTIFVFAGNTGQRFPGSVGYALTYLPFPFLVLGGLVWGARGATLSTFVMATIAVLYTAHGQGPFAGLEGFLGEGVLEVQGYVAAAALLTLMLSALNASRQRALRDAADWKIRYEAILASGDQALYELDPVSGRLAWAGNTMRLIGFAPERVATLAAYLEHVHDDDRERIREVLHALGKGAESTLTIRHRIVSSQGIVRWVEGEASAIIDFDDTVHRVVGFLRPVRSVEDPVPAVAA